MGNRCPSPSASEGRSDSRRWRSGSDGVIVHWQLHGARTDAGSAARALKNLGFSKLALVNPRFDVDDVWARKMAVYASDVMLGASVHDDRDAAREGARTVVGASARVGRHRKPHWRLDAFSDDLAKWSSTGGLAFVFGREDSGLTDLELDRCTHLVKLPASERYTSFNLAQAVFVVGYEWLISGSETPARELDLGATRPATTAELVRPDRQAPVTRIVSALIDEVTNETTNTSMTAA